ncbi:MAG: transglycosylase family protein [Nitriliruptoraceae bacterium]
MPTPPIRSTTLRRSLTGGAVSLVAGAAALLATSGTSVEVRADGLRHEVCVRSGTVADALAAAEVELGPHDAVTPPADTPVEEAPRVVVTRAVRVEVDGREEQVVSLAAEVERELLEREVVNEPVDRVVLVGTAPPPPPLPPAPSGVPSNDDPVWTRLARCESNGNRQLVSANGHYDGGLQFHPQTWRMVGGTGMPHEASRQEQIRRAQILLSQPWATWGNQWPACSRMLGLS